MRIGLITSSNKRVMATIMIVVITVAIGVAAVPNEATLRWTDEQVSLLLAVSTLGRHTLTSTTERRLVTSQPRAGLRPGLVTTGGLSM